MASVVLSEAEKVYIMHGVQVNSPKGGRTIVKTFLKCRVVVCPR